MSIVLATQWKIIWTCISKARTSDWEVFKHHDFTSPRVKSTQINSTQVIKFVFGENYASRQCLRHCVTIICARRFFSPRVIIASILLWERFLVIKAVRVRSLWRSCLSNIGARGKLEFLQNLSEQSKDTRNSTHTDGVLHSLFRENRAQIR